MGTRRARLDVPVLFGGAAASSLLDGLQVYYLLTETSGTRADSVGSATLADAESVASGMLVVLYFHLLGYSPFAYYPLQSDAVDVVGGANGTPSNVTYNASGGPDGDGAAVFNGTSSSITLPHGTLDNTFDGAEFTLALWLQAASEGVWSDGTNRRFLDVTGDGVNYVFISKTSGNVIEYRRFANGTTENVNYSPSGTSPIHIAMTCSETADEIKYYINGAQIDSTDTTIGTWNIATLSRVVIGALPSSQWWSGEISHAALWTSALTPTQLLDLATV